MIQSKANATWKGGLKSGSGTISSRSGVLKEAAFTFAQRFEGSAGTTPEELIGAAHAGCYSMALSANLEKAGYVADRVDTSATVTLEKTDAGQTVTKIDLECTARVPGIAAGDFAKLAEDTRKGCPISRLLNTSIVVSAKLV